MLDANMALSRIETILDEIEQLDRKTCGQFRQAGDREAHDIAARIERKMLTHHRQAVT